MPSFPIWPSRRPFITASSFTVYPPHHLQSCLPISPDRHLIFEPHVMFDRLAIHADVIRYLIHFVTQCSPCKDTSATKPVYRRILHVLGIDIPPVFFNFVGGPYFPETAQFSSVIRSLQPPVPTLPKTAWIVRIAFRRIKVRSSRWRAIGDFHRLALNIIGVSDQRSSSIPVGDGEGNIECSSLAFRFVWSAPNTISLSVLRTHPYQVDSRWQVIMPRRVRRIISGGAFSSTNSTTNLGHGIWPLSAIASGLT